jgi:hypothetical protein
MKFMLLEKEIGAPSADAFHAHLEAEARHVWNLVQQGIVRETYFNSDQHTAVLMLECESRVQVEKLIADFPLVKAGLIDFEIILLQPYDGFARLFNTES